MPITLTEEQVSAIKKAFMYMLISHKAYFDNNVLFRAMKDSGDFEKVVGGPLMDVLQWTEKDTAEVEAMRKRLIEQAQTGRTPEDWFKNAKKALKKEFTVSGKDIVVVAGSAVAVGTALFLGGKVVKAFLNGGKKKKKPGD